MKKKNIATLLFSLFAAASLATGVAVTAAAGGATGGKANTSQNAQTSAAKGSEAYFVNKEDSSAVYAKDNNSDAMGIKASLAAEDKLTLTNVVDLREMYANEEPFVEIKPYVETLGVAEFKRMTIEVIDAYDETNFIKIQMSANPQHEDDSHTSYFLACASNGQKLTGYEASSGRLHVNNEYGQYSTFSFCDRLFTTDSSGKVVNTNDDGRYTGMGLYYDMEKNAIFAVDSSRRKSQIIDFDDPAFFGTYLWSGFTTGEVYCRIKCDDYKKDKASFLVSKYGSFDLSNPEIYDVVKPTISVNYGDYEKSNLPNALLNKAYPIFPATTVDAVDGTLKTDVKVYMNYYSSTPTSVSVKNGAFTPQLPVAHHIVYSAKDAHGNETQEVVQVNVVSSIADLQINLAETPNESMEGDAYVLPAYTVSGALGNAEVGVLVTLNGKALTVENNSVRPYSEGEMTVVYSATDYIGRTCETSFTVTIKEANAPTFIEEPILPKTFISGNTYVLPKLNAYNYVTAQGDSIPTEIYVKENGVEKLLADGEYQPANVTEVQIIYRATIGGAVSEYSYFAPVYNVRNDEGLDMAKYFLGSENTTVSASFDGIILRATENASFEYLNWVTALSLSLEFSLAADLKNAGKMHIYLTDVAHAERMLKFTYVLQGTKAYFYVNDNVSGAVSISGDIEEEKRFSMTFAAEDKKVYYDIQNSNILPVNNFLNGEEFNGFTNYRAYVTLQFEEVNESASVCINALNGHYFSDEVDDWISPLIDLVGNVGGEYAIGSVAMLPTVVANDVLSGDVKAYITVTSPSGKVLTTVDGKYLENYYCDGSELKVKLDEYGSYSISVSAEDGAENSAFIPTVLWVVDTQAPTFTLSGKVALTAKVGAKVTLPTVKATDDLSKKLTVKVYVMMAGGPMLDVTDSKGFVAKVAGTYTVVYFVADEAGNFASNYYTIKVS